MEMFNMSGVWLSRRRSNFGSRSSYFAFAYIDIETALSYGATQVIRNTNHNQIMGPFQHLKCLSSYTPNSLHS